MRSLLCVLAVFMAYVAAGAAEPETNLLENPGFEQGAASPGRWVFNRRNTDSEIVWAKDRGLGGGASARITNATRAESGNVVQSIRINPPLEPGSLVEFSAMAATEELHGGTARIIVYLGRSSGDRDTAVAAGPAGTHDFAEIRGRARVQYPTSRLVVYLCNYGTGTVWWDDARVIVRRAPSAKIAPRPEADRSMPVLVTGDGLGLALSGSGGVDRLVIEDRELPTTADASGLWLVPFEAAATPVVGELTAEAGAIVQRFESAETGLRVEARYRALDETLRVDGWVEDLTGSDRALDVVFGLPLGGENWLWGKSIREEVPAGDEMHVVDETTFSSLSRTSGGDGLALAVPADTPCDCQFTLGDRFGYAVRFRFGLSHAARGDFQGRAPFSFLLYRCDGRWGLRDAARRYYGLFPDAFAKRVEREGLWMFGAPRFPIPDPGNYAFHEGGPTGWEHDDEHGIYTCPYIIPGQREISRLEKLPQSHEEAIALLEAYGQPNESSSDVPGQSLEPAATREKQRRGWGPSMRAIIENCMLVDAADQPHLRIRNTTWGGNSVTFPLNASPWLFSDSDAPTIAKVLLAHVAELHETVPALDGMYVDSLGAWGSYENHRREHFAYTQVPLSYDANSGRPMIPNRFTLLEFLWKLRDEMHEQGKLLFANGLHPDRRFHCFALDVMGVEGHGRLEQKRVMAHQKPFLLLVYNIHDDPATMENYYHLATFYGIYPSFANMRVYATPQMYAPVAALNDCFVPV
ncbi:MAG: hypothetical protein HQ582_12655, partial [Planctomycetes bacterium]|nr:hypothetical protein [Planctomycetota bacterium]